MMANKKDTLDDTLKTLEDIELTNLLTMSLAQWREKLSREICIYAVESVFYVKPYYDIAYKLDTLDGAKEMATRNIQTILRFKYFNRASYSNDIKVNSDINDAIDDRIQAIIKSFNNNFEDSIIRVEIDVPEQSTRHQIIKRLPDYCLAFNDGVYNFKKMDWEFKYRIYYNKDEFGQIKNSYLEYDGDSRTIITWYFNVSFGSGLKEFVEGICKSLNKKNIFEFTIKEMYDLFKSIWEITRDEHNKIIRSENVAITFGLMHNMAHDENYIFNMGKFVHLCEIMGYTIKQEFIQKFIYFIGGGRNGKDSLITGSLLSFIPDDQQMSMSRDELEMRFAVSDLVNAHINSYLENSTDNKVIAEVKTLKKLTGGTKQTWESKGEPRTTGPINTRYIFSANNKEDLKFKDTSPGFIRRINMYEVYYTWDADGNYMLRGDKDWYNVQYGGDYKEIRTEEINLMVYIIFGLLGIYNLTNGFTTNSKDFSRNDWSAKYLEIDMDVKDKLNNIKLKDIIDVIKVPKYKTLLNYFSTDLTIEHKYLCSSRSNSISTKVKSMGFEPSDTFLSDLITKEENYESMLKFFTNTDIAIPIEIIQLVVDDEQKPAQFAKTLRSLHPSMHEIKNAKRNNAPNNIGSSHMTVAIRVIDGDDIAFV